MGVKERGPQRKPKKARNVGLEEDCMKVITLKREFAKKKEPPCPNPAEGLTDGGARGKHITKKRSS